MINYYWDFSFVIFDNTCKIIVDTTEKRANENRSDRWFPGKGSRFAANFLPLCFKVETKTGRVTRRRATRYGAGIAASTNRLSPLRGPPRYTKRVSRRVYVTYVARRAGLMFPVTWPATRYQFVTLSARSRAPTLLFLSRSRERESESALRTRRFRALARRGRKRGSLTLSIEA